MMEHNDNILYRGMRLDNGEWIYGFPLIRKNRAFIATCDNLDFMRISQRGEATLTLIEVSPVTVGAYTSENDMDDVKVFVGDIVENVPDPQSPFVQTYRNVVVFSEGAYFADGLVNIETYDFEYCRVIGNIYEHPELVE